MPVKYSLSHALYALVLASILPLGASAQVFDDEEEAQPVTAPAVNGMPAQASRNAPVYKTKPILKQGDQADDDQEYIFLYMDDFKISRSIQNRISCTMKFYAWAPTRKISEISYRLRWDGIETPISFSNIDENRPTYQTYTLLGQGCYNMDQTPNITVNRCRIKGMNQRDCANMIVWTK